MGAFCRDGKRARTCTIYPQSAARRICNLGSHDSKVFRQEGYEFSEKAITGVCEEFKAKENDDIYSDIGAGVLVTRDVFGISPVIKPLLMCIRQRRWIRHEGSKRPTTRCRLRGLFPVWRCILRGVAIRRVTVLSIGLRVRA